MRNIVNRNQIRLALEPLEERAVPATLIWQGSKGLVTPGKGADANDPKNWLDFDGNPAGRVPGGGDNIQLDNTAENPLYVHPGTALACASHHDRRHLLAGVFPRWARRHSGRRAG
jgi:hypothetical protein